MGQSTTNFGQVRELFIGIPPCHELREMTFRLHNRSVLSSPPLLLSPNYRVSRFHHLARRRALARSLDLADSVLAGDTHPCGRPNRAPSAPHHPPALTGPLRRLTHPTRTLPSLSFPSRRPAHFRWYLATLLTSPCFCTRLVDLADRGMQAGIDVAGSAGTTLCLLHRGSAGVEPVHTTQLRVV